MRVRKSEIKSEVSKNTWKRYVGVQAIFKDREEFCWLNLVRYLVPTPRDHTVESSEFGLRFPASK